MKHLLLYLLLWLSIPIVAKDISDYYVMYRTDNLLCFILPIEIANAEHPREPATFDITYITSEADATVNMTVYTDEALRTDSIIFLGREVRHVNKQFETFYIEKEKKKGWAHRYSCKVPFEAVQQLYASPIAWQLEVYAKGKVLIYRQGERVWREEQKRMKEILNMIRINQDVSNQGQ